MGDEQRSLSDRIWITWERQRRSIELSARLGCTLYCLEFNAGRFLRYIVLSFRTYLVLLRNRPRLLFIQNPSIALAVICCALRPFFRYQLIVDRHTNFMARKPPSLKKLLFSLFSNYSIRHSSLTIVTNRFLADFVNTKGGKSFVLQDPFPDLTRHLRHHESDILPPFGVEPSRYGVYVCTYSPDEPVLEVIRAMSRITDAPNMYITGRIPRAPFPEDVRSVIAKEKVKLTGFLSDHDYFDLLANSRFVMVLTTLEDCLVCGAYEAIALRKPLVLSNKDALREYFGNDVPLYVDNNVESIADGLRMAYFGPIASDSDLERYHRELDSAWKENFRLLCHHIDRLDLPNESYSRNRR